MKLNIILRAFTLMVLLAITGIAIQAQTNKESKQDSLEPTLDETLGFIAGKIADHGKTMTGDSTYITTFKRLKQCEVEFISATQRPGKLAEYHKYIFSLGDIEPLSIRVSPIENKLRWRTFELKTTNNQKTILTESSRDGGKTFYTYPPESLFQAFIDTEPEVGERLVKALKHAVKLCGGKVEPF